MTDLSASISATSKLRLDGDALVSNWRALDEMSGKASAGAAVKANAYGLGVVPVVQKLAAAGCRDFFVATWKEAAEIEDVLGADSAISVLNGVRSDDMAFAATSRAKPVLNSVDQIKHWAQTGRTCDLMINSGMNRLGIDLDELAGVDLDSLQIDIAMSHLASADEDVDQNNEQLARFNDALPLIKSRRRSLANSAGIALGSVFHFDCTRPGLSLFGGKQRPELEGVIKQVAYPQAEILQVRHLNCGDKVGYNAKYIADRDHPIATIAMGYADGYLRGFSNAGSFRSGDCELPVLGRVSMDLIAIDISSAPELGEGDWVDCEYDLPIASRISSISQYELITGLGQRLDRTWV